MNSTSSRRDRKSRWRLGAIALATVVTGAMLASCAAGTPDAGGADDRTLVVGIAGDPANLDPQAGSNSLDNEITKNTYIQWLQYELPKVTGTDFGIVDVTKVIGDAVDVELSEDELTATYTIHEGLTFPSGNPVTTADFRYTVERTFENNLGSIFIFNTAGITDVSQFTEISDTQFSFTLPAPSPMLLPLFRDQSISVLDSVELEKHVTAEDPWGKEWMAQNSLGGGAYTLTSYEAGTEIVLEKNPNYPGADDIYFDKILLRIVAAEDQRAQLLANGTLDMAQGLSVDSALSLQGTDGVSIQGIPSRSQDIMGLVQTYEPLKSEQVRQAIAHAVDYAGLSELVGKGFAEQPKGIWAQGSLSFDPSLDNSPLVNDLELAKSLMVEGGYPDGFPLEIQVSTAEASSQALAVAVQSALAEIGITVTINQVAPATFTENHFAKNGQAFIQALGGSYVDDPFYTLFLFYTSDAVLNWWAMDDAEIDSIAEALKYETDPAKRLELASEAQSRLNEVVPHLVLSEPKYILATGSDIQGFVLEPDGIIRYSTLSRAE